MSDSSQPTWPEYGSVIDVLSRELDRSGAPAAAPAVAEISRALGSLIIGADATKVGQCFGASALGIQRAIQVLYIDAKPVADARVVRTDDMRTDPDAEPDAKRAARAAFERARDELLRDWIEGCAAGLHAAFEKKVEARAARKAAVKDAPVLYAKLKKAAVPQVAELKTTLEKLCREMANCGQTLDAAEIRGQFIGQLERLERVLVRLTPPMKG